MDFIVFATFLLSAAVSAAPSFSNSTITQPPSTITSITSATAAASSCLYPVNPDLGAIGDDPDSDCMRPGDPDVLEGGYNPYVYATWDPIVASSCSKVFQGSYDQFKSTGEVTSYQITPTGENGQPVNTETFVQYKDSFNFVPKSGSGCCLNCTLYGGNVQVYYWPTPAPTPAASILVNEANFTFTFPSVYVAFESLYATDLCGAVGPTYNSTTLAFDPGELKTAMAWSWNGSSPAPPDIPDVFSVADWSYEKNCTNYTSTFLQDDLTGEIYSDYSALPASCKGADDNCWLDGFTITWDPCKPTLSVPTQLFTLNSLWSGCMQGIDAFYDPPYTLSPGNGLNPPITPAPPQVPPAQPITTSVSAQPASVPPPAIVTPTSISSPKAPPAQTTSSEPPPSQPTEANDPSPSSASKDPPTNNSPSSQDPAPPPVTVGTHTLTAGAAPVVISSYTYSFDPSTTALVIDGTTSHIAPVVAPSPSPSTFVIGSQTLVPGGSAATVSGTTYSLPTSGNVVVVNGKTSTLPSPSPSEYVIASQTLIAGGKPITVSGTTYSLATTGAAVIINGVTQHFVQPGSSTYIIGSQTLIAGSPAITVSGTKVSLMPGGSSVVVGGTTEAVDGFIVGSTGTSISGIGGAIMSLGGFATPTSESGKSSPSVGSNGTVQFTGGAKRLAGDLYICIGTGVALWVGALGILIV